MKYGQKNPQTDFFRKKVEVPTTNLDFVKFCFSIKNRTKDTPQFPFPPKKLIPGSPPGRVLVRGPLLLHQLLDLERPEGAGRPHLRLRHARHPRRHLPLQHPHHHRALKEAHEVAHQHGETKKHANIFKNMHTVLYRYVNQRYF